MKRSESTGSRRKIGLLTCTVVFLMLLFSSVSCRKHTVPHPHAVVPQNIYDFSQVNEGDIVSHDFSISNNGSHPLVIQGIVSSCRCMFAKVMDRDIAPGDRMQLSVRLDTSHLQGHIHGKVIVYTNDPEERLLYFTVKAYVKSLFTLEPSSVDFGNITGHNSSEQGIIFTSAGISITSVTSLSPYVKASVKPRGNHTSDIQIRLDKNIPAGLLNSTVLLYTDSPIMPVIKADVKADRISWIQANPAKIFAGAILKDRQSSVYSFYIFSKHRKPFTIKGIKDSNRYLDIKLQRLARDVYKVDLQAESFSVTGEYTSDIIVSTNDRYAPLLQIPFRIIVMAQ